MRLSWAVRALEQAAVNASEWNPFVFQEDKQEPTGERMISVPSSALGVLRQELINTLGIERAKGFLLRYGWNCGVSDTLKMKEMKWENELDLLLAGPKMHTLNGHVQVEVLIHIFDFQKGTVHYEGNWHHSYEAEEHLKLFGQSESPVCHSLVGYASGCLSTIMGKRVIVKETQCKAAGDEHCHWVCKTVEEWDGDIDIENEHTFYEADHIGAELAETYEKLRVERDSLSKTHHIHRKLVKEVLYETGIESIADVLYQTMNIPVMIEDVHYNLQAVGGLSSQQAEKYGDEFKEWLHHQQHKKTETWKGINQTVLLDISSDQKRMITPIYSHQNIYGYCSFLLNETTVKEVVQLVLEQAALACSLHLLNERTRFNTEQRMRGSFLEDILSERISRPEIVKRAHYIEFTLAEPYFMIAIHRRSEQSCSKEDIEFNDQFVNDLLTFFKNKQVNGLVGQKSENILVLLSEAIVLKSKWIKESFSQQLLTYCSKRYPQFVFTLGVSSSSPLIEEAASLYDESLAALKVTNGEHNLILFDSLGLVGMLLQTKNLDMIEKFAYKILGDLIEEDKMKNVELTKTLYYYLDNGSNVHKTARAMNLSISGLRYRLGRIHEILQVDINTSYVRHEIYLALQSLLVLGELEVE